MSDFLVFEGVSKRYGETQAVDSVTFSINRGEIFSLLGPSGCGKITLLRCCAGFEDPDSGRIILDGKDITGLPPHRRKVNTVFQNYALFPHLSIRENIAFGPRTAGWTRGETDKEVSRMLELIQMEEYADRKVTEISGGQKQRIAIARALINRPQVLLLDEPLAALDLKLRQRMLVELDSIHDEVGITFVYVTHDQGEAMGISDRIAAMNLGHIEQIGTPAEIYEAPRSSFVAAFIGDTNFFDGTVTEVMDGSYCRLRIDGFPDVLAWNDKGLQVNNAVHLSLRPEKFNISREQPDALPNRNVVQGTVEDIIYLGSHTKYWVRVEDYRLGIHHQHSRYLLDTRPITWNEKVWISWFADDSYMMERYKPEDENLLVLPDMEVEEEVLPV
jgi:spermidine/putrescine transport system ATP-binding protein